MSGTMEYKCPACGGALAFDLLLICYVSKESLYLALGIYARLHLITLVIQTVEILLLYLAGTLMEHTIQYPIGNERTGKTVFLEVQTIAFNLFTAHGGVVGYFVQLRIAKVKRIHSHGNTSTSKGVILKGDIPIGVNRNGCDVWTEPKYFNLNGQAGAST